MAEEFTFNARQYFDFSKDQDDLNGDSFFEMVHEEDTQIICNQQSSEEVIEIEMSDPESDSVFLSPMTAVASSGSGISTSTIYLKSKMRKSLSMGHLPIDEKPESLEEAIGGLTLEHEEGRPSSSCSHNSKKAPSQEHINRLARPKRFTSADNLNKQEYVSLAEGVKKYQAATPKRFRSRPSPKMNKFAPVPWGGTKAHSPKLMTMQRARPNTNVLSQQDREALEVEEAKKFKIRAHPVNQKVLRGPVKPQIDKKPLTQFEPFKLTEVKKKDQVEQPKIPAFKAQPLPKSLQQPFKPQVAGVKASKPQAPNFSKRLNKSLPKIDTQKKVEPAAKPFKPTKTHPEPFSFEKRDQQMLKKKEELINKVLEEERRAREFHARPPPKAILRSRNQSLDRNSETSSVKSHKQSNENLSIPAFRARPATVLHMKPFEPKRENHDLEVKPFQLTTDQRLEARHKFEEQLKEKEMMKEAMKRELEEIQKRKEEEEVARLRKETEYKAQPIKKYKEVVIQRSHKVTLPISPVFHTDRLRNKENIEH